MVQLTLAFRRQPRDTRSEMVGEEKSVDILNSAELQRAFLTEINPKGQVSTLIYLYSQPNREKENHIGPSANAPDYTT
jgi:hypothetical protein